MSEDQPDPQRFVRRYEALLKQVRHMMRFSMHLEEVLEAEISEAKREADAEKEL